MPARAVLALLLACAVPALAGCGGDGAKAGAEPIRIGVVIDCGGGTFSEASEASLSGAELPLIERGASLRGTHPSAGVAGATVAGLTVRLYTACARWGDRTTQIQALSTLVERDGADIVLGPGNVGESITVRDYARSHPGITFLATSFEQSATLKQPAPNMFRFEPDAAQWYAGLGAYARHMLGWSSAVIVGEPDPVGWTEAAGFESEFCSLGGRATRLWPADSDTGLAVRRIPHGVDGVLLTGISSGGLLGGTGSFVPKWAKRHPNIGRHLLVGWSVMSRAPALVGVVGANSNPYRDTAAWNRFLTSYRRAFPGLAARWGITDQPYYDAMEPVLEALAQVHGDLSGSEHRLMAVLAGLRYHSPEGLIRLDARHQAIAPIYLGEVERDASGAITIKQIATIKNVEQTFGGYFGPDTPAPSATQPGCTSGHPPPWAVNRDRGSTR